MPKFSGRASTPPQPTSPISSTGMPLPTAEGGAGVARDPKSELFLLAITNMVGEDTFYESGKDRDTRFESLIATVTAQDADWMRRFIPWLRDTAQMRSASIVAAAEYARAKGPTPRAVIASACQRADEPAELLGYWTSRYGKRLPMAVKRGVADAARRLYNERSALKYDGQSRSWRMADVVELCHPKPTAPWQSDLFKWLLEKRHNRAQPKNTLPLITSSMALDATPSERRRAALTEGGPALLADAGYTWERLGGWLPGGMDAQAWEAMIPTMGYMALLRNLRNFDEAKVSDKVAAGVAEKLADPEQVAKSRQFPIRFLSAWKATTSMRWAAALEAAVQHSVSNVPALAGRTLILIDCSGSMDTPISDRSQAKRWEVAAVFGLALAQRAEKADVACYSNNIVKLHGLTGSVLRGAEKIRTFSELWGGTNTWGAVYSTFNNHDRVVLLTDEQAHDSPYNRNLPTRLYTFNLAGYKAAHCEHGSQGRYAVGGLTDAGFRMIAMLEECRDGAWPF